MISASLFLLCSSTFLFASSTIFWSSVWRFFPSSSEISFSSSAVLISLCDSALAFLIPILASSARRFAILAISFLLSSVRGGIFIIRLSHIF
jgi:hypothetical protein